ncbi:hypothetical protein Q7Z32_004576, partial [Salmonella enterica]|nr:hypothetical protein [Salmonella enterica]
VNRSTFFYRYKTPQSLAPQGIDTYLSLTFFPTVMPKVSSKGNPPFQADFLTPKTNPKNHDLEVPPIHPAKTVLDRQKGR